MIFHSGSNCDYHFIIKEIPKEFDRECNCLGKILKNIKKFSVPITKEVKRIAKKWGRNDENHIL